MVPEARYAACKKRVRARDVYARDEEGECAMNSWISAEVSE